MKALVNEVEIMSAQIEKKAGLEELGARLESKMDKVVAKTALNSKPSRAEVETVLNRKAEIGEVQQMMHTLEVKFEDEFNSIHEQISRKACIDEMAFFRGEM